MRGCTTFRTKVKWNRGYFRVEMITWKQIGAWGACMVVPILIKAGLVLSGGSNPELYQMAVAVNAIECIWLLTYTWIAFYYVTEVFDNCHMARVARMMWGIHIFQVIAIFPGVMAWLGGWKLLQSGYSLE